MTSMGAVAWLAMAANALSAGSTTSVMYERASGRSALSIASQGSFSTHPNAVLGRKPGAACMTSALADC